MSTNMDLHEATQIWVLNQCAANAESGHRDAWGNKPFNPADHDPADIKVTVEFQAIQEGYCETCECYVGGIEARIETPKKSYYESFTPDFGQFMTELAAIAAEVD